MFTVKLPAWDCESVSTTEFVPVPKRTCWRRFALLLLAVLTVTVTRSVPEPVRADLTVTGGRGLQEFGVDIVGAAVGVAVGTGAGAPPLPTAADAFTRP
jgi:hypothetical protein